MVWNIIRLKIPFLKFAGRLLDLRCLKDIKKVVSDLEQSMQGRGGGPSGRSRSRMLDSSYRPRTGCQMPLSGWNTCMRKMLQEINNKISLQVLPTDLFQFKSSKGNLIAEQIIGALTVSTF